MDERVEQEPIHNQEAEIITARLRHERDTSAKANYIVLLQDRFYDSDISHELKQCGQSLQQLSSSFDRVGFEAGSVVGLRVLDELMTPSSFNRLAKKLVAIMEQEQQFAAERYNYSRRSEAILHGILGFAAQGFQDMEGYGAILHDPEMIVTLGQASVYGAEEGFGLVMALRQEVLKDIEAEEKIITGRGIKD